MKTSLAGLALVLLAGILPAFAWADQLADIRASHRLRVAIINGLPNFSETLPKVGFVGSDVDTAKLLAKDLGVSLEFVYVANAERINAIETKKADIILSGFSVTPEREQIVAFSVPYASIALLVGAPRKYQISSYADLRGKRIGVGRNTSDGALLKQNAQGAEIIEYEDEHSLINAYLQGQFDIISCQHATLNQINAKAGGERRLEPKFIQHEYQVAIAMRKNERELRKWINNWVVTNLANGKLNEIFRLHHGRNLPESVLPKPVIKD